MHISEWENCSTHQQLLALDYWPSTPDPDPGPTTLEPPTPDSDFQFPVFTPGPQLGPRSATPTHDCKLDLRSLIPTPILDLVPQWSNLMINLTLFTNSRHALSRRCCRSLNSLIRTIINRSLSSYRAVWVGAVFYWSSNGIIKSLLWCWMIPTRSTKHQPAVVV